MRFSVKNLLALTCLTCLAMAIIRERKVIATIASNLATLQVATEQAADNCREKERDIELFTKTINKRTTDLDRLSRTVDQAAQLINQATLRTIDLSARDNTVSIVRIQTFSRNDEFRERKKIHVPEDLAYELRLSFLDSDGNIGCYEDFEEPEQLSIPLVKGENLIEFFYDGFRVPNIYTLTNHTTGVSIHTRSKNVHGGGRSFTGERTPNYQLNFPPHVGLPTVSAAYLGPNSRIVVQMVESSNE